MTTQPLVPQFFRWRWTGGPHAPLPLAVPVALAARAAFLRVLNGQGVAQWPDAFHHARQGEGFSAFWLPEDADGDGLIDHVACLHGPGFAPNLLPGFEAGADLSVSRGQYRGRLEPDWMGPVLPGGPFGPATDWMSVTPYVTPRDIEAGKGRGAPRDVEYQLVRDLRRAGLPPPVELVALPVPAHGPRHEALDFVRAAGDRVRWGPSRRATFVTLRFPVPVMGPLVLGAGAHFGLGQFAPASA